MDSFRGASRADAHVPVLRDAVVAYLARPDAVLVDATVGHGGHSAALLEASGPRARLLGLDLDATALPRAAATLAPFGDRVRLVHGSFADLAGLLAAARWPRPSGVLFDLGLRSDQLTAGRGFSFREDSPLDMRYDSARQVRLPRPDHPALARLARTVPAYTAADVVGRLSTEALAEVLASYGEERFAARIAEAITRERKRRVVAKTADLVRVIVRAVPPPARHGRRHIATRTFQALRIAVNREREVLRAGLSSALAVLTTGGRLAVITYHSGEDRITKEILRSAGNSFHVLTPRPLTPNPAAVEKNPRARSAKLRIAERSTLNSLLNSLHQP